jgi:transposase
MRQLREILRLKLSCGLTHREIARSCGVGAGTVVEYLRRARDAGLSWPLPDELDDAALEARLFPPVLDASVVREPPDWCWVLQELRRKHVTLQLLWSEYAAAHPTNHYRYSQFCELYRRFAARLKPSMRQVHRAGEKAFVDFAGSKPQIADPATGAVRDVELFLGVLGASSLTYAEAVETQELDQWIGAHVRMFEAWGGSPEILVPDNLKSGVTKACKYEPEINRSYGEMAAHYGSVVIPARAYRPKDKAKVEAGVLLAERWILAVLRHRTFFSIQELNAAIGALLVQLNERRMRALGVSRRELFEKLDRPALKLLPPRRYALGEWKTCRVNIDYHIDIEHNLYSVSYTLLYEKVEARIGREVVEVFHNGQRITSHQRLRGRGRCSTHPEHMPAAHRAHAEWTPSRLIHWAEKSGPATGRVVEQILRLRPHPEQGYRACLGLMRLGKKHGHERLEAACLRAEHLAAFSFKNVKNILQAGLDRVPLEDDSPSPSSVQQHHPNIRGAGYYAPEENEC